MLAALVPVLCQVDLSIGSFVNFLLDLEALVNHNSLTSARARMIWYLLLACLRTKTYLLSLKRLVRALLLLLGCRTILLGSLGQDLTFEGWELSRLFGRLLRRF